MSWSRTELKTRAKDALKRNYWKCILVAFILAFVTPSGNSGNSSNITNSINQFMENRDSQRQYTNPDQYFNYSDSSEANPPRLMTASYSPQRTNSGSYASDALQNTVLAVVLIIVSIVMVIALGLSIFLFHPLQVGGCSFFIENAWISSAGPGQLLHAFKHNYKTTVLTMFMRNLFISLWSLLFVIPGIIKAYEYRMIPYLLADNPELSWQEVFEQSKKMMKGEKWNAFILDVSFLGWGILSALTLNLLGIFYVNPYIHATNAELYLALKRIMNRPDYY